MYLVLFYAIAGQSQNVKGQGWGYEVCFMNEDDERCPQLYT